MAKKESLKKQIKDVKEQIKNNSTDVKFAEKLIKKLMLLKGQDDLKPLPIGEFGKELGRFEGKTFYIAKYEFCVVYHIYNSIDLVVQPNITSLYETLCDYVDNKDLYETLTAEEKEIYDLDLEAKALVLALPLYVFTNVEFTYDVANTILGFLSKTSESLMNEPLQDETPEENQEFKESSLALEGIKEELEKESEED